MNGSLPFLEWSQTVRDIEAVIEVFGEHHCAKVVHADYNDQVEIVFINAPLGITDTRLVERSQTRWVVVLDKSNEEVQYALSYTGVGVYHSKSNIKTLTQLRNEFKRCVKRETKIFEKRLKDLSRILQDIESTPDNPADEAA